MFKLLHVNPAVGFQLYEEPDLKFYYMINFVTHLSQTKGFRRRVHLKSDESWKPFKKLRRPGKTQFNLNPFNDNSCIK